MKNEWNSYVEVALLGRHAGRTDGLDVLVGGWESRRGSVVASETVADPVVGVSRGSGVYGVVTFGPEVSDVGVLSAGEMSMSWLGRSIQISKNSKYMRNFFFKLLNF